MTSDGSLIKTEMRGPDCFDAWRVSYRIFKVTAVMLNIASIGALDLYFEHVKYLSGAFGHEMWMLLSQAERRMRNEQWERLRRRG